MKRSLLVLFCLVMFPLLAFSGCSGDSSSGPGGGGSGGAKRRKPFFSMGTSPLGGTFQVVGDALCQVLNEKLQSQRMKFQAKATKGSRENIRRVDRGELELAIANSSITYFAVRGQEPWDRSYQVRTVMTLAPNVIMLLTLKDSGIKTIQDIKGKRVVVGPAGAGFEMFLGPLLAEHGVTYDDFQPLNNNQAGAVDMLGDGSADVICLGGVIPSGTIARACTTYDIHFIPFDPEACNRLVQKYPFFHHIVVPGGTYPDLPDDFPALNVGSMHVITGKDMDADTVYLITKTLYEQREAVLKRHPVGKFINPQNAPSYTGTPFHPGAIRFYREQGIWPAENTTNGATPPEAEAQPPGANTTAPLDQPPVDPLPRD